MKSLHIPKRERLKGQTIICRKCGNKRCSLKGNDGEIKWVCKSTGKQISSCPNPESQKFYSLIYNPITRLLDIRVPHITRDFWEFRKEHLLLLDIGKEIKSLYKQGKIQQVQNIIANYKKTRKKPTKKVAVHKKSMPKTKKENEVIPVMITPDTYLESAMNIYIEFLNGRMGWEYEERPKNQRTINGYSLKLERFYNVLVNNGYNPQIISLSAINEDHLHCYIQEIKDNYTNPSSFKHYINDVSTFFNWLEKRGSGKICNILSNVELGSTKGDTTIAEMNDFVKMIKSITPENGKGFEKWISKKTGKEIIKTKNYYRDWLADGYWLSLLLGQRGDDITLLKWKEVKSKTTIDGNTTYWIEQMDHKENHQSHTPIFKQTYEVLLKLGLKENIGLDAFILAPDEKNRANMKRIMGNSFRWYWREVCGLDSKVMYKSLRSTFITLAYNLVGEKYKFFMKHTQLDTARKHYMDKSVAASEVFENDFYGLQIA